MQVAAPGRKRPGRNPTIVTTGTRTMLAGLATILTLAWTAPPAGQDGPAPPAGQDGPDDRTDQDGPAPPADQDGPARPAGQDGSAPPAGQDGPDDRTDQDGPAPPAGQDGPDDRTDQDGPARPAGQDGSDDRADPPTAASQEDTIPVAEGEMILERETYAYPGGARRNPFLPPGAPARSAPGAEEVALLGIIHHPDPMYRVAVIRVRGAAAGAAGANGHPPPATASRLRIGERRAGVRVVAIEADHVVVELQEPGGRTRSVLAMPRPETGRGS